MSLNPPTEHQLLVFWVSLLVILVAARLLGAVMQRIGQPAVIGELAAGLIPVSYTHLTLPTKRIV